MKSLVLLTLLISLLFAEKSIYVKYRGMVKVDNQQLKHQSIQSSSLVTDMYYDSANKYLIVKLKETYYHYCGINSNVVSNWIDSSSLGSYYLNEIKGNYDCRIYPIPKY